MNRRSAAASVRDITERKRSEEALRESEQRHRALVDYTFDGFVITEGGVVREANRGFAQMFGYSVEAVIGKPVGAFVAIVIFLLLLVEGLVWAWRKGVLNWK